MTTFYDLWYNHCKRVSNFTRSWRQFFNPRADLIFPSVQNSQDKLNVSQKTFDDSLLRRTPTSHPFLSCLLPPILLGLPPPCLPPNFTHGCTNNANSANYSIWLIFRVTGVTLINYIHLLTIFNYLHLLFRKPHFRGDFAGYRLNKHEGNRLEILQWEWFCEYVRSVSFKQYVLVK